MNLEEIIAAGRGEKESDLVIKNAQVIDVLSGEIFLTNVAIFAGRIVGFGNYRGRGVLDIEGHYLSPGFFDAHIHLESSTLIPEEFTRAVVPLGTTSVVADPHEIANVLGIEGINYILRSSENLPLNVFIMLPSCVPATKLETSGAELGSEELSFLINHPQVLGIAEMMNFQGVIQGDAKVLKKIESARGKRIDGHAPGLSGKELCAYIDAGIRSDHECVTAAEAQEKLRLGMYIMVRQGSTAKNLKEILRILTPQNSRQFMLVSDDKSPQDLLLEGHVDYLIKLALAQGVNPITAIQMVTLNPAQYFGLSHLGAIALGYQADLVVLEDLKNLKVLKTIKDGKIVAEEGRMLPFKKEGIGKAIRSSVNINLESLEKLRIPAEAEEIKVISVIPDQIVTEKWMVKAKISQGEVVADPDRDILKIVVVERHRATGNIGLGFVQGFGLKKGAIASSVAHDSHNIIAVGVHDEDIKKAVIEIQRLGGGQVAIEDGKVKAALALPVAGLMSDKPADKVAAGAREVVRAAQSLGCSLPNPFMTLSFLALPVIPKLKITDKGLVDVERFAIVSLFND